MKYVKQNDKYSCGPIAIINVLKHLGFNVSKSTALEPITKKCKCTPLSGTQYKHMNDAIKYYIKPFVKKIEFKNCIQIRTIKKELDKGKILILRIAKKTENNSGHFILAFNSTSHGFYTVNFYKDKPILYFETWERFKFHQTGLTNHRYAWIFNLKDTKYTGRLF